MKDLKFYNTVSVSTKAFAWAFISKVLQEYLFEWKNTVEMDSDFDPNESTWMLSGKVLQSFWLLNPTKKEDVNIWIYRWETLDRVLIYLQNKGWDDKKVAEAIVNPNEIWYEESVTFEENWERLTWWFNKIYYWVPWCGKSYQVNKDFYDYKIFRTTFHPDYSNSDFVWQIIPKANEWNVTYDFQEWPFTEAILYAYQHPTEKVCLVIEELNRWNASAIFWDIFQLLDRDVNWRSEYDIDNYAIKQFFHKKWCNSYDKVFIPSNLRIISTMNTSDQNVYTLDTAFQRRWRRERIPNEFTDDNYLANMLVPWSECTWKDFVQKINKAILHRNPAGLNWEDKQIWVYFVSENELVWPEDDNIEERKKAFVEKVLRYIWDDVSKLDPSQWFISEIKSFDELIISFNEKNLNIFRDIFQDLDNWENS